MPVAASGRKIYADRSFVSEFRAPRPLSGWTKENRFFRRMSARLYAGGAVLGGKTYYQRYSDERGRERQYKLGPADVLTLDQARRKARQVLAEALLGPDPQQRRRDMRAVPQLSSFAHECYLPYVRTYKSSWQTDETVLRVHILPTLGRLALDEIKTDAISDLINRMRTDSYACGTINRSL